MKSGNQNHRIRRWCRLTFVCAALLIACLIAAAGLGGYEQLIVWPILQSMAHDPELIIAVGNGWWTAGTSIVGIQTASAAAWARLFDKPLVISFNH